MTFPKVILLLAMFEFIDWKLHDVIKQEDLKLFCYITVWRNAHPLLTSIGGQAWSSKTKCWNSDRLWLDSRSPRKRSYLFSSFSTSVISTWNKKQTKKANRFFLRNQWFKSNQQTICERYHCCKTMREHSERSFPSNPFSYLPFSVTCK